VGDTIATVSKAAAAPIIQGGEHRSNEHQVYGIRLTRLA